MRLWRRAPRPRTSPEDDGFLPTTPVPTWWNNAPVTAIPVFVEVGFDLSTRHAWAATLAGTIRYAVRIDYLGHRFYIDNDDGSGWYKVTHGGAPTLPHRRLPVAQEVGI